MTFREIELADERIWLLAGGAVFLPETQTLVVADLHLGKGTSARTRGLLLPPGDTVSTLEKVQRLVKDYKPQLLIALGDSFHDVKAGERLLNIEKTMLRTIASQTSLLWITGNHDALPVPEIAGEWLEDYRSGNLILRHIPSETVPMGKAELAGHLHPKIRMRIRGHAMSRSCFVKGPDRLILPALGSYTGGLDVSDPAFSGLFADGSSAYVWGADRISRVA
ncbi:ligase-associated DNA damage response endonuclease PdeM [Gluconobacter roseus]|uniref:Metallophosphatase n=1 Tax=Gluconobacter roseus NBRC 3990 TaxID=1307950 RepID=A0A4Y3M452_9PROT|nr:ligase-associated DNA damage response endonuclease PdeM [Gluconobacter roseus]KXV43922.1 metallophosphoesterase [Gluconobacter roseus]GBR48163.1 putative ICC-like phosphoesterase [Gluconobacter roseus NBRC 3990]GEB03394.1 metallophosphatase [Gluconobacter roseus NBRC 3990]GLP93852.1 metallophosphatase [Gluconobacter roseus NBRC 3990]